MTGRDLVNFITSNKLEDIKVQTEWTDGLVWSIFLDKDHEIEYTWHYKGKHKVELIDWAKFDEEKDDRIPKECLTFEEALLRRGLA